MKPQIITEKKVAVKVNSKIPKAPVFKAHLIAVIGGVPHNQVRKSSFAVSVVLCHSKDHST